MTSNHPMFQEFPLAGDVQLPGRLAPTPYHVYDGDGVTIYGRVDAGAGQSLFEAEDVYPVLCEDGTVPAGFIIAEFRDASMGPHCELQFFILASYREGDVIDSRAMSLPLAMALRPDWGTMCVKLWNNDRDVIDYNNNYLGLNASFADFEIDLAGNQNGVGFTVTDEADGPILAATIKGLKSTQLSAAWEMVRIAGLRNMMKLGRGPYFRGSVVNRKSEVLPQNRQAPILTSSDKSASKFWNPETDQLAIDHSEIAALGFVPRAVQHITPFRFIYLHPDALA